MACDHGKERTAGCSCRAQKVKVWFVREVSYGTLQLKEGEENHM